jgi:tripartite-type tricarboxylate transporter receptor subunit TctC
VAGQIDLLVGGPDQLPLMRAGSIEAYAVLSGARLAQAPKIQTIQEIGLSSLSYSTWFGLFAPKSTPTEIIRELNKAVVKALANAPLQSRFAELGYEIYPEERQTPEALGALVKADAEKWWPIIKELGIRPE